MIAIIIMSKDWVSGELLPLERFCFDLASFPTRAEIRPKVNINGKDEIIDKTTHAVIVDGDEVGLVGSSRDELYEQFQTAIRKLSLVSGRLGELEVVGDLTWTMALEMREGEEPVVCGHLSWVLE